MKKRNVLVTGGAGCIGIQVCNTLHQMQIPVVCFDFDAQIERIQNHLPKDIQISSGSILDVEVLSQAMKGCDTIIHLAAFMGVQRTEQNRRECLEVNVQGTRNVLDCAVKHKIKKIVFASSSEVYGSPIENPISEKSYIHANTVYAVSKLTGEELCKAYSQSNPELKYTILRYFNVYGNFQVRQFVVPNFIHNVRHDKSPVIYGDGKQIRSFCYSEDAAKMTVASLLNKKTDGEIINIGNSQETVSLLELAGLTIDLSDKLELVEPIVDPHFEMADRCEAREVYVRFCDTSKANKLLNIRASVNLKEGLRHLYDDAVFFDSWYS